MTRGSWLSSGTQVKHFPFWFTLGGSKVERYSYHTKNSTTLCLCTDIGGGEGGGVESTPILLFRGYPYSAQAEYPCHAGVPCSCPGIVEGVACSLVQVRGRYDLKIEQFKFIPCPGGAEEGHGHAL